MGMARGLLMAIGLIVVALVILSFIRRNKP
jgi:hypothetical protein